MSVNLKLSSSAGGTRNLGPVNMGGGANMIERSLFASNAPTLPYAQWLVPGNGSPAISTSDYYLMNGWYWSFPYDLDLMGAEGAAIKAREGGKRYLWIICADHIGDFIGSYGVFTAYSTDPQILPDPTTMWLLMEVGTLANVIDQNGVTQNNFRPYHIPWLVYNPDTPSAAAIAAGVSSTNKFYIYMECDANGSQHETGLITSADMLTATIIGPAIPTTAFGGWSSYARPRRLGVNSWETYAFGRLDGVGGTATTPQQYKYTSTDGWVWSSTFSTIADTYGSFVTIEGVNCILGVERPGGPEHMAYWPVNSSGQFSGAPTYISEAFEDSATAYPWQTFCQDIQTYEENGVVSILITRGWPVAWHDATIFGPYLGNVPHMYSITGSVTSNVLTVTSWPGGVAPIAVNFRVRESGLPSYITSFGTGTGGVGTYNMVSSNGDLSSRTLTIITNGGLWHQFVDLYYLITNATAAASAAPLGVKASCTAGVVTISWNNCLPHQNYRVYRGTTAATQATLIGDVTGVSTTNTPTPGAQYFYKVVTMNGGEQRSRVVSVYASNNTEIVNRHVNRVINDGGDTSKINMTFLVAADAWLTANDCWRYVNWWIDVRFGVKIDGSGFISKIYCLGTTQLPRGGDYTPTTSNTYPSTSSNTSYSATSFRGTTPSWVNNAAAAHGYYGNGRINNIQRWNEITMIAAYQKPGTAAAGLFGMGEFNGIYLEHSSGASGNINFAISPSSGTGYTVASVAFSGATTARVAAGVQAADGTMTAYLDGTPGTPVATAYANPNLVGGETLRGALVDGTSHLFDKRFLGSGTTTGILKTAPPYRMGNAALYTGAGHAIFNKGLSQTLIQSWGALYA